MTRGEVVQVRVSVEEKARMVGLASSAGVKLSDWVRSRALGDSVTLTARDVEAAIRVNPEPVIDQKVLRAEMMKQMAEPQLFRCPVAHCGFAAKSPNAVCNSHGKKVR